MIMALAFVPKENVRAYYGNLIATPFFAGNMQELEPLLKGVERTWIGETVIGRHKKPLFEIGFWSCYERELNGWPLTTNAVEGWHRGFNSLVQSSHPSIWALIDALQKNNAMNNLDREQLDAGIATAKTKKMYKDKHEYILDLMQNFSTMDPLKYLKNIAKHLVV